MTILPRLLGALLTGCLVLSFPARSEEIDFSNWPAVLEAAAGQSVAFNAWGGSQNINDYLDWAAEEVERLYDVELRHVPIEDAADAVARVLAEKTAGRDTDGSIDLIWINGENFAAMKEQDLLSEPFAALLPNWDFLDIENQPTIVTDFTIPTEGRESPWGGAKLVFFADTARTGPIERMPRSAEALLQWARAHPGRFAYPTPGDFIGTTFLKQVLFETAENPSVLPQPVEESDFAAVTAPLFVYLDALRPHLWRQGRDYPANYPALKQLMADGELDIIFSFNPAEASGAIAAGELPETVRSFVFEGGTLGNTHFVAIPYNSGSKAAAAVVANFLISPQAQLRKEDPAVWGDPTVLSMVKLPPETRAAFEAVDRGPATLSGDDLGLVIPEPHPSWTEALEAEWRRRYAG